MINGTTQAAHQKLVSIIEAALPGIIGIAVDTETAPLNAEISALKGVVNKAQEDANLVGIKAADLIQAKQDIIAGLQSTLSASRVELETERANHLATAAALTKARNELEALKAPKVELAKAP